MLGLRAVSKISLFNGVSVWRVHAESEVHFLPQRICSVLIRLLSGERQELVLFKGFKMLIYKISIWFSSGKGIKHEYSLKFKI